MNLSGYGEFHRHYHLVVLRPDGLHQEGYEEVVVPSNRL
jgi:hypothetical protein